MKYVHEIHSKFRNRYKYDNRIPPIMIHRRLKEKILSKFVEGLIGLIVLMMKKMIGTTNNSQSYQYRYYLANWEEKKMQNTKIESSRKTNAEATIQEIHELKSDALSE